MDIRTIKVALSIKEKMLENLHIIKELQNGDFKEKIEKITNKTFSTPTDFIKYKILNFIKNTKYIGKIIENDNIEFISFINSQSDLHIRDKILERLITNQPVDERILKLELKNDIDYILQNIIDKKDFSTNLMNPFNNIKTTINSFHTKKDTPSLLISNNTALKQKEFNKAFRIVINKNIVDKTKFDIFDYKKEEKLMLEFILFHELAHASYSQITRQQYNNNKNEKNSDMVSILKIIKNHDFDINETKDLLSLILKLRTKKAGLNIHNILNNNTEISRVHFTEESLLNLKSFLSNENNLNYIKSIKDFELSTFCEIVESNTIKLDKYTEKETNPNKRVLIIKTIIEDSKFIETTKEDYDKSYTSNIKKCSSFIYSETEGAYTATKDYIDKINRRIISQCENNKNYFNDLYIMHQLRTNFDNYIKTTEKELNIDISNNIKNEFENYQKNKSDIDISIDNSITVKQLRKKLKNI